MRNSHVKALSTLLRRRLPTHVYSELKVRGMLDGVVVSVPKNMAAYVLSALISDRYVFDRIDESSSESTSLKITGKA